MNGAAPARAARLIKVRRVREEKEFEVIINLIRRIATAGL